MPVDYSHNANYDRGPKTETPVVSWCECGHVLEWHYSLAPYKGGVSPAFRSSNAHICPATPFGCPCTVPKWDGQEPRKVTPVGQTSAERVA